MALAGSLDADSFLDEYWQKRPLRLPAGCPSGMPELSPDELGWLATLDDVESRLVFTESTRRGSSYRVSHGPFSSRDLERLPPENWTLLVHDVDKHLPEFRAWFGLCDFIPDWRVDDLMISFAAPGGGVGPHTDNYDVFLVQGRGARVWRCAERGSVRPAKLKGQLALLEPFEDPEPFTAAGGDVLYLPPGVPHWGTATDACTTYSIGFRAPTLHDLAMTLGRLVGEPGSHDAAGEEGLFYADPDLRAAEARPGIISVAAVLRAASLLGRVASRSLLDVGRALGIVVTTTKEWLTPDAMEQKLAASLGSAVIAGAPARVHGMARIAHCCIEGEYRVFANGQERAASASEAALVVELCQHREIRLPAPGLRTMSGGEMAELLTWLASVGAIEPVGPDFDSEP